MMIYRSDIVQYLIIVFIKEKELDLYQVLFLFLKNIEFYLLAIFYTANVNRP